MDGECGGRQSRTRQRERGGAGIVNGIRWRWNTDHSSRCHVRAIWPTERLGKVQRAKGGRWHDGDIMASSLLGLEAPAVSKVFSRNRRLFTNYLEGPACGITVTFWSLLSLEGCMVTISTPTRKSLTDLWNSEMKWPAIWLRICHAVLRHQHLPSVSSLQSLVVVGEGGGWGGGVLRVDSEEILFQSHFRCTDSLGCRDLALLTNTGTKSDVLEFYLLILLFHSCTVTLGFFSVAIRFAFPGESQLLQSRATQPTSACRVL